MVQMAHDIGKRVECVTNGTLLDDEMIHALAGAGMNQIWISVDGLTEEVYDSIRLHGDLQVIQENIRRIGEIRKTLIGKDLELGLTFVAMRDNIHQLTNLMNLAYKMDAGHVKITHVLPYTPEMVDQALYMHTLRTQAFLQREWGEGEYHEDGRDGGASHVDFPIMDLDDVTIMPVADMLKTANSNSFSTMGMPLMRKENYCRFVQEGLVFVKWNGEITQCMALLHPSVTYLHGYRREIKPYSFGNLADQTLAEVWGSADYVAFRDKVKRFDFAYCTTCGGCYRIESNEEDCFGNEHPACGACLWAQGFIQCP